MRKARCSFGIHSFFSSLWGAPFDTGFETSWHGSHLGRERVLQNSVFWSSFVSSGASRNGPLAWCPRKLIVSSLWQLGSVRWLAQSRALAELWWWYLTPRRGSIWGLLESTSRMISLCGRSTTAMGLIRNSSHLLPHSSCSPPRHGFRDLAWVAFWPRACAQELGLWVKLRVKRSKDPRDCARC